MEKKTLKIKNKENMMEEIQEEPQRRDRSPRTDRHAVDVTSDPLLIRMILFMTHHA